MQPTELVTLNMRELDRLKVIQSVVDGLLKPWRAATAPYHPVRLASPTSLLHAFPALTRPRGNLARELHKRAQHRGRRWIRPGEQQFTHRMPFAKRPIHYVIHMNALDRSGNQRNAEPRADESE